MWKAWIHMNAEHMRMNTQMQGLILSAFERGTEDADTERAGRSRVWLQSVHRYGVHVDVDHELWVSMSGGLVCV